MEKWFAKWGLYVYAACALCWLIGYVADWDKLLWTGVVVALLSTSVTEALEWWHTHKKVHLVIPVLTVLWLIGCMCILLNRLL